MGVNSNAANLPQIKPGTPGLFPFSSAPAGWLKANGAAVSRTAYAALFAAIGTTFGAGDGSTTFNLPDDRGEFWRCTDDGRGVDSGRAVNSAQSFAIENITGRFGDSTLRLSDADSFTSGAFYRDSSGLSNIAPGSGGSAAASWRFDASRVINTASETRPRNRAYLACIKY